MFKNKLDFVLGFYFLFGKHKVSGLIKIITTIYFFLVAYVFKPTLFVTMPNLIWPNDEICLSPNVLNH